MLCFGLVVCQARPVSSRDEDPLVALRLQQLSAGRCRTQGLQNNKSSSTVVFNVSYFLACAAPCKHAKDESLGHELLDEEAVI